VIVAPTPAIESDAARAASLPASPLPTGGGLPPPRLVRRRALVPPSRKVVYTSMALWCSHPRRMRRCQVAGSALPQLQHRARPWSSPRLFPA
jgi:hypothetical protein